MARKRNFLFTFCFLLSLAGGAGGLYFLFHHEPGFYRRAYISPGPERLKFSEEFFGEFSKVLQQFIDGNGLWKSEFTDTQVNSFFEEGFVKLGAAEDLRKVGISNPRVTFEKDRVRLGFRYSNGVWNTVLTYDLKFWLAPKEMNAIAVEILGRKAGAIPMPSQHLLNELGEMARRHHLDVSWFRHDGNPVALVRFQTDRPQPTAQILQLRLAQGQITIAGNSIDPNRQSSLPIEFQPFCEGSKISRTFSWR